MSKALQLKLTELKNRGNKELSEEVAAFIEANTKKLNTTFPVARRLLAQAARELREGGDPSIAHDYLGASIEVFRDESEGRTPNLPTPVSAALSDDLAPEQAFRNIQEVAIEESPEFNEAPQELAQTLANLLRAGGYVDEARRYLTAYNSKDERDQTVATTTKQALKKLQAQYHKAGDLIRARALEEVISDLDEKNEELPPEDFSAESKGEGEEEGEEKPVLPVEPPSDEENAEKESAQAALAKGNIKKAKAHLAKASKMERLRLTAALIKAGDMELAMAGLDEMAKEDAIPAEEKAGGYSKPEEECEDDEATGEGDDLGEAHDHDEKPSDDECAKREKEAEAKSKEEEDEVKVAEAIARHIRKSVRAGKLTAAKAALKDLTKLEKEIIAGVETAEKKLGNMALAKEGFGVWKEVRALALASTKVIAEDEGDDKAVEKADEGLESLKEETPFTAPAPQENAEPEAPAPVEDKEEDKGEEKDEKEEAQAMVQQIRKAIRAGRMVSAKRSLKALDNLEKAIVAGVKTAEDKLKDEALAKEGYALWKEVRAMNLKAIKMVAAEEGDEEKVEKAEEGLDALDKGSDELDKSLDTEPSEEGEEAAPKIDEEKGEADAMKYEVLQNLEDLKNMKVGRDALAFTFWESQEDPYWTIQAAGKPIAEVHLADQNDPQDVAAFFCDQVKWPNVIAQTTERVGIYDMLKGVKARFYAHGITKSNLANSLKLEVEASLKEVRAERLGTLRTDFVDAMQVAADALNKGLIAGKSNPLKRAFVDKLASLGFSNPALVVEECFANSFRPYLDQVIADAQEYLEMPKEAFAHTRRMVNSASNVAVAQANQFSDETLSERLARRSMPLAPSSEAYEAPNEIEASLRLMSASEKQNDMKRRLRLGSKY